MFYQEGETQFCWEKKSQESSLEGESIKRVEAGLRLPAQPLGQRPCSAATFRWLALKLQSFGAAGALPRSASPRDCSESPLGHRFPAGNADSRSILNATACPQRLLTVPLGTDGLQWPSDEAVREQDARTHCTKSSAGAQAIFFKKPGNSSLAALQQGCRLLGQGAPGAPGSNPAVPLDVTAHAETSLLSLSDALSDAALHFPVADGTPVMRFKLIFFSGKAGKTPLSRC